jgi:hypothetical protein
MALPLIPGNLGEHALACAVVPGPFPTGDRFLTVCEGNAADGATVGGYFSAARQFRDRAVPAFEPRAARTQSGGTGATFDLAGPAAIHGCGTAIREMLSSSDWSVRCRPK